VGNAVVDVPLVQTGFRGIVEAQEGDIDPQEPRFENLTFARNRALQSTSAPPRAPVVEFVPRIEAVGERCAGDFPSNPVHRRPEPWAKAGGGGAPLLEILPSVWQGGRAEATLYRTAFVGNDSGSAPLVELDFGGSELQASVLHSLFADNISAGSVVVRGSLGSGRLSVARNLVLDEGLFLEVEGAGVSTLELTMNAGVEGVGWNSEFAAPLRVEGPAQVLGDADLAWEAPEVLRALGPRVQFDEIASGATDEERSALEASSGPWPCPTDRAAEFVPTDEVISTWWMHWPWDTGFLLSGETGRFGPTGGTYHLDNGPLDRSRDGDWGDSDGYSHLVDCDNDDPEVGPARPPLDGFIDQDCYQETCWSCPPGSNIVQSPSDDDDAVDDDDSTEPAPTPAPRTEIEPPADCGCSGCGVYYTRPIGGAFLLIGLLGLRRHHDAWA